MTRQGRAQPDGFTLIVVVLVVGLLVVISALAMPVLFSRIKERQLITSCRQFASLVSLTRAHAHLDGRRYRIRFLDEEEAQELEIKDDRQPVIEREGDRFENEDEESGEWYPVKAAWAYGETLLGDVWCAEVRLGKPTIEALQDRRDWIEELQDALEQTFRDIDPLRPPLVIEPDGTSDWATFVFTEAPRDLDLKELEDEVRIEVIVEGLTGLAWLQRPFYDEELDLFEEKNWPAVLRQDLLTTDVLTEDDVLELHERRIQRVAYEGSKPAATP
jgi:type II secretory pathway pseudopilin PulG